MDDAAEFMNFFIADLVFKYRVEGQLEDLAEISTCVIEAATSNEAHDKAFEIGREREVDFEDYRGRMVTIVFVGIRHLHCVAEGFRHGAVLRYIDDVLLSDDELSAMAASLARASVDVG